MGSFSIHRRAVRPNLQVGYGVLRMQWKTMPQNLHGKRAKDMPRCTYVPAVRIRRKRFTAAVILGALDGRPYLCMMKGATRIAGLTFTQRTFVWLLLVNMSLSQFMVHASAWEWLVHIGDVVAHFEEHKVDDPELTFVHFFRLHFGDLAHDHAEEHDHGDLPFQCHHPELATSCFQVFLPMHMVYVTPPAGPWTKVVLPLSNCFTPQARIADIWQPPKHC
jgi:hypothetical protein